LKAIAELEEEGPKRKYC